MLSYLVLVRSATAALGPLEYRLTILWWLGFGASLFAVPVGWWAVLPLLALVVWPRSWAEVRQALIAVRKVVRTGALIAVDEPSAPRAT